MAVFTYKARNQKGQIVEDSIESSSKKEVAVILRNQKLQVLTVREMKGSQSLVTRARSVSVVEKAIFCRYLSTMLKAGLPLAEAVEIMTKEAANRKMQHILRDLEYSLQRGQKISVAFSRYPEVFDPIFLTLTRAGEESGTLEEAFNYLSKMLMRNYELGQKVKGALLYPAVIVSAMIGVGIIMVTFVLPKMSKVFLRLNIKLPIATRLLLNISDFLGKNYIVVLVVTVILVIFLLILLHYHKTRRHLIRFAAKFPILRRLFDQLDFALFSRTLSTLLKSGVPILESIKVAVESLTQPKFSDLGKKLEEEIKKGRSLSDAISEDKKLFPPMMTQSINAGEKTGSLEIVLGELGDFYEQEVEHTLKNFTAILEPVVMLIIGVAVGAMVISIIAPIYNIIGTLQPEMQ